MEVKMPRGRLEVESMKTTILAALGKQHQDLYEFINREVNTQISKRSWSRLVRKTIEDVVAEELYKYYRLGEGRKAILAAIVDSLTQGE